MFDLSLYSTVFEYHFNSQPQYLYYFQKSFSRYFNDIGDMPLYIPGKNLKQCREVLFDPFPPCVLLLPSVISLVCVLSDFVSVLVTYIVMYP